MGIWQVAGCLDNLGEQPWLQGGLQKSLRASPGLAYHAPSAPSCWLPTFPCHAPDTSHLNADSERYDQKKRRCVFKNLFIPLQMCF